MAYDEGVAQRVREAMRGLRQFEEKKMFGGIAFMHRGHMCVGVVGKELMLRVGPDGHEDALKRPHARPMDFTGKPMKGFIYVAPKGFHADKDLNAWVGRAVKFVKSLPTK